MKIAVVTGSRAEYGILKHLLTLLRENHHVQLQLLVTGTHLSPEFGKTVDVIKQDGFSPKAEIDVLLSSDTTLGTAKSIGIGILGFVEHLARLKPDITVVLGDRFEIFAAGVAALHTNSILAHIHGGDVAIGVFDNYYRNSLTQMAHIHFTATLPSMQRVLLMGKNPEYVYLTGSPSQDELHSTHIIARQDIAAELNLDPSKPWCTVVYHPLSDMKQTLAEFEAITKALKSMDTNQGLQVILFYPNADAGGRRLTKAIDTLKLPTWQTVVNLPRNKYISLLKHSKFMLGNSSSGIIDTPYLKLPTINVGKRQHNRVRGDNILDVTGEEQEIKAAIHRILTDKKFIETLQASSSPYGDGQSSKRILNTLLSLKNTSITEHSSTFYDNTHIVSQLKQITSLDYEQFPAHGAKYNTLLSLWSQNE